MTNGFPRAVLAYHHTTSPAGGFQNLPWELEQLVLNGGSKQRRIDFSSIDIFALLVNAQMGISSEMSELWQQAQDRQIPRILLVQDISAGDIDFDDIVLIGARILEPLATPYLVIHGESGDPIGLISLQDLQVREYSNNQMVARSADQELINLVKDFQSEFLQDFVAFGDDAFENGMYAIALPISAEIGFGFPELSELLLKLPRR